MPALANWRHELYARNLVEIQGAGFDRKTLPKKRVEAYTSAGFAPNADNARRDANRKDIKARVQELFAEALEYRDVRAVSVVTRIDRIGRANIRDFYDTNGKLKTINALPRELTEAIKSVKHNDDGSIEFELWDKNQANFTLLKFMGGLPDDRDNRPTSITNIFGFLSVDDQRTLAEALEALPAGPATLDLETAGERGAD